MHEIEPGESPGPETDVRKILIAAVALLVPSMAESQLAPPNEAGVRFAHVHLYVADVDLHATLWPRLFGGELLREAGYTALSIPGAQIFFTEQAPTAPSPGTAVDHVGIKVQDLDAVLGRWRSLGYEVDAEFTGGEGLRQAYITMPGGARVELAGDPSLEGASEMHHVHFYSPRHREMLAWYTEMFAAVPRTRGTIETTADVPGSTLSFPESEGAVGPTPGTAIDPIGFEVEDIESFAEMLESKGVEFDTPPFYVESLDLWVAFFRDPNGTRVEITEGLYHFGR